LYRQQETSLIGVMDCSELKLMAYFFDLQLSSRWLWSPFRFLEISATQQLSCFCYGLKGKCYQWQSNCNDRINMYSMWMPLIGWIHEHQLDNLNIKLGVANAIQLDRQTRLHLNIINCCMV